MLKRALTTGLLALTLGVGGLLSTPNTAEAQRWMRWIPNTGGYGYYNSPYYGGNWRYNTYWNSPGYYNNNNNNWNWNNNYGYDNRWYPGYYYDQARRYWDPSYGMYYRYDPYTGQSYWEY